MSQNNFTELNPAQKEAVKTIDGPLLVLAGAGTGKTRVITYRIAHMLEKWIDPGSILALTFTNKAATEMRERVQQLVNSDSGQRIFLGTFHAFAVRVLRKEVSHTSLHSGFTIADDVDQKAILKQAVAELGFNNYGIDINVYRYIISKAKNNLIFPDQYKLRANDFTGKAAAKVYSKYQEILQIQNMVDFDDIISKTIELWQNNQQVLEKYQDTYRYILVDEFQDTNHAQYKLIELLTGERKNICVVGDDDQSIYEWRGADVNNILDFPIKFPGTKMVKLEQNYRSTNTILKAANSFIMGTKNRHNKALWSKNGEGAKIKLYQVKTDIEEGEFCVNEIYRIKNHDSFAQYKDIALLYRSNHQSRIFEQQFRKDHIPYRLVGSRSFYERKEVRDAIAYLKLLVNPWDDQSFLRIIGVPSRGLGKKAITTLRNIQGKKYSPLCLLLNSEEFLSGISGTGKENAKAFFATYQKWKKAFSEPGSISMKAKGYLLDIGFLDGFQKIYKNIDEAESRKENVNELINAMAQYEQDFLQEAKLLGFLEHFSLFDDSDKVEEENNSAITLMTVHSAKGLEFPYIFVVGMENGIFPHSRSIDEHGDSDEERRLFYVAITRAKKRLVISNAQERLRFGKKTRQSSSPFLSELPEELLETNLTEPPVEEEVVDNAFSSFYDQFSS